MPVTTSDPLASARDALARHEWQAALTAANALQVDDPALDAERLALAGEAAWWLGRLDECIDARSQAHRAYDSLGDSQRAGQLAVWLYENNCQRARPSVASGWLQRARRALGSERDCVEHGALLLREAELLHGAGRLVEAAAGSNAVSFMRRLVRIARDVWRTNVPDPVEVFDYDLGVRVTMPQLETMARRFAERHRREHLAPFAVHDACHYLLDAPPTPLGEAMVARFQQRHMIYDPDPFGASLAVLLAGWIIGRHAHVARMLDRFNSEFGDRTPGAAVTAGVPVPAMASAPEASATPSENGSHSSATCSPAITACRAR